MPYHPNHFDHLSHSNQHDHQPGATTPLGPAGFPPGLFSTTTPATIADLHTNHGPWWTRRDWSRYLQDLLLYRSRRRYTLSISDGADQPLGATDPRAKQVYVNPTAIAYPDDPAQRQYIRHIPASIVPFQQAITVALVEHEAGHIRHSGEKPTQTLLAWLWNAVVLVYVLDKNSASSYISRAEYMTHSAIGFLGSGASLCALGFVP